MTLTSAQKKWLGRANDKGVIRYYGPKGYGRAVWVKMMNRLAEDGLVKHSGFGDDYYITDKGIEARKEQP